MDKTGRNGLRIGDIKSFEFRNRYDKLVAKHKRMLDNDFMDFDLDILEKNGLME